MIDSRASYGDLNLYDIYFKNYVAMSFYLIDAHESGHEFSFLGYADADGLEFHELHTTKDCVRRRGAPSYSPWYLDLDYNTAKCPICGGGILVKANPNRYGHKNVMYCENLKCGDILSYFKPSIKNDGSVDKRASQIRKVAKISGATQKAVRESISKMVFDELISLSMISVFTDENGGNKLAIKSNLLTLQSASELSGVSVANITRASNGGKLYGVKFPKKIKDGWQDFISKKDFELWLNNNDVQERINRA